MLWNVKIWFLCLILVLLAEVAELSCNQPVKPTPLVRNAVTLQAAPCPEKRGSARNPDKENAAPVMTSSSQAVASTSSDLDLPTKNLRKKPTESGEKGGLKQNFIFGCVYLFLFWDTNTENLLPPYSPLKIWHVYLKNWFWGKISHYEVDSYSILGN